MGKGRSSGIKHKAVQQGISAGMDIVTRVGGPPPPTKAELRASIPTYDSSLIKKIETGKKAIKKG